VGLESPAEVSEVEESLGPASLAGVWWELTRARKVLERAERAARDSDT